MVRKAASLAVLIFFFASSAFSQINSATASTGKTAYLIGDYIHYKIQVGYSQGLTVYPPMIQDSLKHVALLKTQKPVFADTNHVITATYTFVLSGYDSAQVTIPAIPIFYRAPGDTSLLSAPTNPVTFTVSTVKVNMKEGIKDVKAPIKIPFDWRWLLVWLAAALIVAAIAYYIYRQYKKKKAAAASAKPVVKILPHEVALNALRSLQQQQLWQKGMIKEYHSGITEIIRRYFEERFDMQAMELPTSEAVDLLRTRPGSEPVLELTYNFLSNADMVKFAKFTPMNSVNEEMMKQAYEIVNKTTPVAGAVEKQGAAGV